jgi:hypothetical protein
MASPPIEKGSYYGQGPQPVQQGIPMQGFQQQQQQSQYHVAMPLQNLLEGAAPVDCPACHTRTLTRTEYVSGNTTMWVPILLDPSLLSSMCYGGRLQRDRLLITAGLF